MQHKTGSDQTELSSFTKSWHYHTGLPQATCEMSLVLWWIYNEKEIDFLKRKMNNNRGNCSRQLSILYVQQDLHYLWMTEWMKWMNEMNEELYSCVNVFSWR